MSVALLVCSRAADLDEYGCLLPQPQLTPSEDGLRSEGERRRERTHDALVRYLEGPAGARPEVRLAPVKLVGPNLAYRRVPVCACALDNPCERAELLLVPRDEQSPDALQGYPGPMGVGTQQLVTATD